MGWVGSAGGKEIMHVMSLHMKWEATPWRQTDECTASAIQSSVSVEAVERVFGRYAAT